MVIFLVALIFWVKKIGRSPSVRGASIHLFYPLKQNLRFGRVVLEKMLESEIIGQNFTPHIFFEGRRKWGKVKTNKRSRHTDEWADFPLVSFFKNRNSSL